MAAIPNYVKRLVEAHAAGQLQAGTVAQAEIRHDDWCETWRGKPCNCEPDIEIKYRGMH